MASAARKVEPATRRAAEASAAVMLLQERTLLGKLVAILLLYGRIADNQLRRLENQSADQVAAGGTRILKAASADLETAAATAILAARAGARWAALAELRKQVAVADRLLLRAGAPVRKGDLELHGRTAPTVDASQSSTTAGSLADAWHRDSLARLFGWAREGAEGRIPPVGENAAQAAKFRARRSAATEVAQAYNDEAHSQFIELSARLENTVITPLLFKRWEAVLDRVVCGRCANYDNQVVPVNEGFRGGQVPGFVHPNCRCEACLALHEADLNVAHAVAREMFGPGLGRMAGGRRDNFENAHQWTDEERAEWTRRYRKAQSDPDDRAKIVRPEFRRHMDSAEKGAETASAIVPRLRRENVMARDRRSTRQVHDDTGGAFVIRERPERVMGARDWRAKRDQTVPRGRRLGQ